MNYSLAIHPQVNDDVLDIFLFIDKNSSLQADLFAEQLLLEYEKIISELNSKIFYQKKRVVKSRSIGKFKRYLVFYSVDETLKQVLILAAAYGGKDPDLLNDLLNGRLDN